jgi:hypothetical protein
MSNRSIDWDKWKRVTERQLEQAQRVAAALDDGVQQCPAVSPESRVACTLPDLAKLHRAGHEGVLSPSSGAVWPTTVEDRERWRQAAGEL